MSGTAPSPIRLAASAGKAERRSSVAVKKTLTRSPGSMPLRSSIARSSRSVAANTCSGASSSTRMAPRTARTRSCATAATLLALRKPARPSRADVPPRARPGSRALPPKGATSSVDAPRSRPRLQAGDAVEGPDLVGRELPELPGAQPPEPDRTHPGPHEATDGEPHRLEHPAHLALATLREDELDAAPPAAAPGRTGLHRAGGPILELDPPSKPSELS